MSADDLLHEAALAAPVVTVLSDPLLRAGDYPLTESVYDTVREAVLSPEVEKREFCAIALPAGEQARCGTLDSLKDLRERQSYLVFIKTPAGRCLFQNVDATALVIESLSNEPQALLRSPSGETGVVRVGDHIGRECVLVREIDYGSRCLVAGTGSRARLCVQRSK